MSHARQPLTCAEGLALVNSMIKDKDLGAAVVKFKQECHMVNEKADPQVLGPRYWSNFLKRNSYCLKSKRCQKFSKDCANWSKRSYIKRMYNLIYQDYIDTKIAVKCEPTFCD